MKFNRIWPHLIAIILVLALTGINAQVNIVPSKNANEHSSSTQTPKEKKGTTHIAYTSGNKVTIYL